VAAALAGFVAALRLDALDTGDPKRVIAVCAARLAARIDEGDPPASVVAQLRSCVRDLAATPGEPGGSLDLARARRHERRLNLLLGT
jgi:hypothetical protein